MKLISSAIKCKPVDSEYEMIFTGKRHCDIFEFMFNYHIQYDKLSAIQGFMTDNYQFVDRYEAKEIAIKANQLIIPEFETYAELYSEDIW